MNMMVRLDALNMLNSPIFNQDPNLNPNSSNFGKIFRDNGQWNKPRILQFGFKFQW